jgi:hypothetical protein
MQSEPLLVFVHIPKTGGTVLTSVLRTNEPGDGIRHGGNVFKGSGGLRQHVRFERLLANDAGELDRARFIAGHFPLGIREFMPPNREARYFALLREPADRTLSHFFRIRERRGGAEAPNKLGLPPLPADATVEDALERGYIHDNVQTRMLSGLPEPFGEVTDEMLGRAKQNLRGLAFIGLTERFDESLVLAKRRLGLRTILYRSKGRVNEKRPRGGDVPDELRRAAEACNRYDLELYKHAEQLFESAPERRELDFEVELGGLRAANANGQRDLDPEIPASFGGDQGAWRMLLDERARVHDLENELALVSVKRTRQNRVRAKAVGKRKGSKRGKRLTDGSNG